MWSRWIRVWDAAYIIVITCAYPLYYVAHQCIDASNGTFGQHPSHDNSFPCNKGPALQLLYILQHPGPLLKALVWPVSLSEAHFPVSFWLAVVYGAAVVILAPKGGLARSFWVISGKASPKLVPLLVHCFRPGTPWPHAIRSGLPFEGFTNIFFALALPASLKLQSMVVIQDFLTVALICWRMGDAWPYPISRMALLLRQAGLSMIAILISYCTCGTGAAVPHSGLRLHARMRGPVPCKATIGTATAGKKAAQAAARCSRLSLLPCAYQSPFESSVLWAKIPSLDPCDLCPNAFHRACMAASTFGYHVAGMAVRSGCIELHMELLKMAAAAAAAGQQQQQVQEPQHLAQGVQQHPHPTGGSSGTPATPAAAPAGDAANREDLMQSLLATLGLPHDYDAMVRAQFGSHLLTLTPALGGASERWAVMGSRPMQAYETPAVSHVEPPAVVMSPAPASLRARRPAAAGHAADRHVVTLLLTVHGAAEQLLDPQGLELLVLLQGEFLPVIKTTWSELDPDGNDTAAPLVASSGHDHLHLGLPPSLALHRRQLVAEVSCPLGQVGSMSMALTCKGVMGQARWVLLVPAEHAPVAEEVTKLQERSLAHQRGAADGEGKQQDGSGGGGVMPPGLPLHNLNECIGDLGRWLRHRVHQLQAPHRNSDSARSLAGRLSSVTSAWSASSGKAQPPAAAAAASPPAAGAPSLEDPAYQSHMRTVHRQLLEFALEHGCVATASLLLQACGPDGTAGAGAGAGRSGLWGSKPPTLHLGSLADIAEASRAHSPEGLTLLHRAVRSACPAAVSALLLAAEGAGGAGAATGSAESTLGWACPDAYGLSPLHYAAVLEDGGALSRYILLHYPATVALWTGGQQQQQAQVGGGATEAAGAGAAMDGQEASAMSATPAQFAESSGVEVDLEAIAAERKRRRVSRARLVSASLLGFPLQEAEARFQQYAMARGLAAPSAAALLHVALCIAGLTEAVFLPALLGPGGAAALTGGEESTAQGVVADRGMPLGRVAGATGALMGLALWAGAFGATPQRYFTSLQYWWLAGWSCSAIAAVLVVVGLLLPGAAGYTEAAAGGGTGVGLVGGSIGLHCGGAALHHLLLLALPGRQYALCTVLLVEALVLGGTGAAAWGRLLPLSLLLAALLRSAGGLVLTLLADVRARALYVRDTQLLPHLKA